MSTEILDHTIDCQCIKCKAFFWQLFVTDSERDVIDAEATPLGVWPLEPEGGR